MLDSIRTQIEKTKDRASVLKLMQEVDSPLAVLKIKTDWLAGELWVVKGKFLVFGKVDKDSDSPLIDMLRLLAVKEAKFSLEIRDKKPPECPVEITIAEVVADEHAVARKIKDALWPVSQEEKARAAKARSAAAQNPAEADEEMRRLVADMEITNQSINTDPGLGDSLTDNAKDGKKDVASEAKDSAEEAKEPEIDESKLASLFADDEDGEWDAEKDNEEEALAAGLSSLFDQEETKKQAGENKAAPAAGGETETKDAAAEKPAETEVAATEPAHEKEPAAVVESKPEPVDKPEPVAETKPEPAVPAATDGPKIVKLASILDVPAVAVSKADTPVAEPPHKSAWDFAEEESSPAAAVGSTPEPAKTAAVEPPHRTAWDSIEEKTPPAAAQIAEAQPDSPRLTNEMITAVSAIMEKSFVEKPEKKEVDPASAKRAADYEAMKLFYGEEADKFYEGDPSMKGDDLKAQMSAEVKAVGDAAKEIFGETRGVDPTTTNENLKAKRRADYEALKLFYAEDPQKFNEETKLRNENQKGLNEFQKRILEIVNEENQDKESFNERDPRLEAGRDVKPRWSIDTLPQDERLAGSPEQAPSEPEFVSKEVDSPYMEMAGDLARHHALKSKLAVQAGDESLDLLMRQPDQSKEMLSAPESRFRRSAGMPNKVIVAAVAAALLLPVLVILVMHALDAQAQEDIAQQREAALLAERSVEEKSMVQAPQEPFRMPAASQGPSQAPSAVDYGNEAGEDEGGGPDLSEFHFKKPTQPQQVLSGAAQEDVARQMQMAEQNIGGGKGDMGLSLYSNALKQYPSSVQLRLAAIRAYMKMRKFRTAKAIGIEGLNIAATQADFDNIMALLKQIP